jgi:ubiquinone/menaquinone biosynthesis C-methylase UbiE
MKISDVQYLNCVDCQGELALKESQTQGDLIENALLKCLSCERYFPILNKVGVFFKTEHIDLFLHPFEIIILKKLNWYHLVTAQTTGKDPLAEDQLRGVRNYEYQWGEISLWDEKYFEKPGFADLKNFKNFIPINFEKIKNQTVLVGCGGRGRETYHLLKHKPSKIFVVELGKSIYEIAKNISDPESKLILLRADIKHPPLKNQIIDIAICDHALQHVVDHKSAFKKMSDVTKENGIVAVCVYSYEGNFIMTHMVEPAKLLLLKLPVRFLRFVSFFPSLVVYLLIKMVYIPASKISKRLAHSLPMGNHFIFWSDFPLEMLWSSINDLINAPVTYHFTEDEMISLADNNYLKIEKLIRTHGTTWSMMAKNEQV